MTTLRISVGNLLRDKGLVGAADFRPSGLSMGDSNSTIGHRSSWGWRGLLDGPDYRGILYAESDGAELSECEVRVRTALVEAVLSPIWELEVSTDPETLKETWTTDIYGNTCLTLHFGESEVCISSRHDLFGWTLTVGDQEYYGEDAPPLAELLAAVASQVHPIVNLVTFLGSFDTDFFRAARHLDQAVNDLAAKVESLAVDADDKDSEADVWQVEIKRQPVDVVAELAEANSALMKVLRELHSEVTGATPLRRHFAYSTRDEFRKLDQQLSPMTSKILGIVNGVTNSDKRAQLLSAHEFKDFLDNLSTLAEPLWSRPPATHFAPPIDGVELMDAPMKLKEYLGDDPTIAELLGGDGVQFLALRKRVAIVREESESESALGYIRFYRSRPQAFESLLASISRLRAATH